jgi:hypothetical protein
MARLLVLADVGHLPQIEDADAVLGHIGSAEPGHTL